MLDDPEVGFDPDHAPLALHDEASLEFQLNVEEPPLGTLVGLAFNVSVGAGAEAFTVTDAEREIEPPGPLQLNV